MLTGEPRIDDPHATLTVLCEAICLLNDPQTVAGNGGNISRSKPKSKPPGRQQCQSAVRKAATILCKAAEELTRVYAEAMPYEPQESATVSIGGRDLTGERVKAEAAEVQRMLRKAERLGVL